MTRNNTVLAVVAAIVASAAFYFLLLSPKREEAGQLKADVQAAQAELQQARTDLANYQAAKATYQASYSAVVRLGKAIPADDDVRSLMVQLDSAANRSRVDFRSIQVGGGPGAAAPAAAPGAAPAGGSLPPGVTVGAAGLPVMPFSFTFRGSFFRLSDFFRRMEHFVSLRNKKIAVSGRLMTVDSITLQPDTDGFPQIKAQVGATSYLVSPAEGVTGGATPQGPAGTTAQPAAAAGGSAGSGAASTTATSTGAAR